MSVSGTILQKQKCGWKKSKVEKLRENMVHCRVDTLILESILESIADYTVFWARKKGKKNLLDSFCPLFIGA